MIKKSKNINIIHDNRPYLPKLQYSDNILVLRNNFSHTENSTMEALSNGNYAI